jgi:hypothetical protein
MRWLGILAVFALSVGFGLLALGNHLQVTEAREIWANGRVAQGKVVEHQGYPGSSRRTYTYTYRLGDAEFTAERRAIPWEARDIPVGSKLEVRYDPRDPKKSITSAEMQERQSLWNVGFLPAFALAWLLLAVWLASPSRSKGK